MKTAIIYWSGTGNTEAMAGAILEGVKSVNSDVACFMVSEISPQEATEYDTLILGCPAMGAEVLEESEFDPFFTDLEPMLSGKNVALFGSYGWGDGQWMRDWEERVTSAGANLVGGAGLILNDAPDSEGLQQCNDLGKQAGSL